MGVYKNNKYKNYMLTNDILQKILELYPGLFDVNSYKFTGRISDVEIKFTNTNIDNRELIISISLGNILNISGYTPSIYIMRLFLDEAMGELTLNNNKTHLSDKFCALLYDLNIIVTDKITDSQGIKVFRYDLEAIHRKWILDNITNE